MIELLLIIIVIVLLWPAILLVLTLLGKALAWIMLALVVIGGAATVLGGLPEGTFDAVVTVFCIGFFVWFVRLVINDLREMGWFKRKG